MQNNGYASDEQKQVYHNQTAILTWLKSRGHQVNYVRDNSVPSIHLPSRYSFIGNPCPYCGEIMSKRGPRRLSRDHKTPRSQGGMLTAQNRIIVCEPCNADKKNYTLEEWHERLRNGRDPRADRIAQLIVST